MDENIDPTPETKSKRSKIKIVAAGLAAAVGIYAASYFAAKAVGKNLVPDHEG